jgi:hypothetical protein
VSLRDSGWNRTSGSRQSAGGLGVRWFGRSGSAGADAAEQQGCRLRSLTLTSLKHGAGWAPRRQPLHVIRNANPLRAQRLEQRSTQIVQYGPNPEGIS